MHFEQGRAGGRNLADLRSAASASGLTGGDKS